MPFLVECDRCGAQTRLVLKGSGEGPEFPSHWVTVTLTKEWTTRATWLICTGCEKDLGTFMGEARKKNEVEPD